jgi:hypothetical protein
VDIEAAKIEYDRLCWWRETWLALANNNERMKRMGGLHSQMEYVIRRSQIANNKITVLLQKVWAEEREQIIKAIIGKPSLEVIQQLRSQSIAYRITSENGRAAILTQDMRNDRINLVIDNDQVTKAYIG